MTTADGGGATNATTSDGAEGGATTDGTSSGGDPLEGIFAGNP